MPGRITDSKRVKKGEVIALHPLPEATRTELNRTEAEEQAAKIRAVYLDKKSRPKKTPVGPATTMRERILACSLFPNVYNQHYLQKAI